jgi:hypothetical protein
MADRKPNAAQDNVDADAAAAAELARDADLQRRIRLYETRYDPRPDGLLPMEGICADALEDAAKTFGMLPVLDEWDTVEFSSAVERLRNLLRVRIVRRIYPADV